MIRPRSETATHLDPEALLRIQSLELRSRIVMEGARLGQHRTRRRGTSQEFAEYRHYQPGDDPRHLDWKLYARSDRYYIKRFEDETNRNCHLLLDVSRSMEYGSRIVTKTDYATTLVATLAQFLTGQQDAVGLATFTTTVQKYLPPASKRGHLRRLFGLLEGTASNTETNLNRPLEQLAERIRKPGLVVIVTDALTELDGLSGKLASLKASRQELLLLRILDPGEIELPFASVSRLRDVETAAVIDIDPHTLAETYRQNFREHEQKLIAIAQELGITLHTIRTDTPLPDALTDCIRHTGRPHITTAH